jgi:hypothetical protein
MHSVVNTHNLILLKEIPALMITQANVLAYGTVFRVAGILLGIGGISALFVRESKRDFAPGEKAQNEHVMIEM